jgi:hypothetical protein
MVESVVTSNLMITIQNITSFSLDSNDLTGSKRFRVLLENISRAAR